MLDKYRRLVVGIATVCLGMHLFTGCVPLSPQNRLQTDTPGAIVDAVTTVEDMPVTIRAPANDIASNRSAVPVATLTQAHGGAVVVHDDGTMTYTPHPGFSGEDTFTYTMSHGTLLAPPITVTVRVLSRAQVAHEVAAGAMHFLRTILTPETTGGLPRNEATQSQLTSGRFPAEGFFVPAQLGTWFAAAVLSHALRSQEPAFTAGFSTEELRAHVEAAVTALEVILQTYAFTDTVTGGKALYQVHCTPTGEAPRENGFERTISLLDNAFLLVGLHVTAAYFQALDPALAARIEALLSQFNLRMWVDGNTVYLGGPDNPRRGGIVDRILTEGRLAVVAALARGELSAAAFQAIIRALLANSPAGVTPDGVRIAHLPFSGTALEIWAVTPYLGTELQTRLGTDTLTPLVAAWEETRRRLPLPAAGATGVADGFEHFRHFALPPAEDTRHPFLVQRVLIPPATGMQAGAMGTPEALQNLGRVFLALQSAGQFHPQFGVPNYLDFGTGLVNEADPVRGTLEIGQMAVALLNALLPRAQRLEALLRQNTGWAAALEVYATLLNEQTSAPAATARQQ